MFVARMLIVGALLWPGVAMAADQDKRALAEEMLTLVNGQKMIDQTVQQTSVMMQQQLKAANIPPDMQPAVDQMSLELVSYMREKLDWAKLKPQFVDLYMDVFSEEELRQVVAFYKSPGGQAVLNKMPQLMQRSMSMIQGMMADMTPHLQEMGARMQKQIEEKRKQTKP